jgi:twitching motility two-component system response regulator PilG
MRPDGCQHGRQICEKPGGGELYSGCRRGAASGGISVGEGRISAACVRRHGGAYVIMVQVIFLRKFYGHSGEIGVGTRTRQRAQIGRGIPVSNKPSRSLNGLKILVVDDSKTIRRTAETLLSKEGCQVFTAIDGFDALSKIADHNPDLIFVDIMMPRLDGYQTCSLIKHNKVYKDTPVIMLSSKDGLFDRARGRIVGSEQYLTKPFTRNELLGAITNQIH